MEEVYFIIDRFEENVAICENQSTGEMVTIERSAIISSAREGDVIYLEKGLYKISTSQTQKAKQDIIALLQKNQNIE